MAGQPGGLRRRSRRYDLDPDAVVVGAARCGDDEAIAELFRRCAADVHRHLRRVERDPHRRNDIVQDAFLRAIDRLESLRDPTRFRPWLMRIARNAAIDEQRRQRETDEFNEARHRSDRVDGGPEELLAAATLIADVRGALDRLPARDARAVRLAAGHGCGPDQLGRQLGLKPGAAKVALHRARRRLRAELAIV